jgi:hypothetical protein
MATAVWGTHPGAIGSEYDIKGDPLRHQEVVPKPGVTPKYDNPGIDRGG